MPRRREDYRGGDAPSGPKDTVPPGTYAESGANTPDQFKITLPIEWEQLKRDLKFWPRHIVLNNGEGEVLRINADTGQVILGPEAKLDEASKLFWQYVENNWPGGEGLTKGK